MTRNATTDDSDYKDARTLRERKKKLWRKYIE
jgi:hypothetical protein